MLTQPNINNAAWHYLPGTSQELALSAPVDDIFYTGGRGPGKTDCQLMRFRMRVGMGYGEYWRGIIFDREYKHLDDLVAKSKRWFYRFNDGCKWLSAAKDYKWTWPTGEELLFRVVKKIDDYANYHGHEYPYIGWNELAKYPTSELYDMMFSVNRTSFMPEVHTPDFLDTPLPRIPLETFSTSNSLGPGHNWCKRRFIDVAPYGEIIRKSDGRTQMSIFGSPLENPYLDPKYVSSLLNDPDPNRRKAWFYGSWDVVAGGALDDVWEQSIHILPRTSIPVSWRIDRSFDWGSTHPFSVGWWARATGEELVLANGKVICPPPKSLIQVYEWYGSEDIGSNVGLKLSADDIARGIKEREDYLLEHKWIGNKPRPGPADNEIRNVRESDIDTIEDKMASIGIKWAHSDKSAGSRRVGLQLVRDMLQAAKMNKRDQPHLYFMENCRASISTIPILPRDETYVDDVDSDAEDHAYDMVRYRVLHQPKDYVKDIRVIFPGSGV